MENETIQHPATMAAETKESTTENFPLYFKCEAINLVVKQESELKLKYVQVVKFDTGSFKHHRGLTCYPNTDRLQEFLQAKELIPASESEFISMLKNYFGIDKKVREGFLKSVEDRNEIRQFTKSMV